MSWPTERPHAPKGGRARQDEPLSLTMLRLVDALMGSALFVAIYMVFRHDAPVHVFKVAFLIFTMTILFFHSAGIYRSWRFSALEQEISQIVSGCVALYFFLFLLVFLLNVPHDAIRGPGFVWMAVWPVVLALERTAVRKVLRHYRVRGHNIRRAVIAGVGATGDELAQLIENNPWSGTQLLGFFDDHETSTATRFPLLGGLEDLVAYVKKERVDFVYLTLPQREEERIRSLLTNLADTTASVYFIPDVFFLDLVLGGSLVYFDYFPVIALRESPIRGVNSILKRIEDLVIAGISLLVTAPLFIVIPLLIRLTSPGPVIFRQWRYGLNGEPIEVYKFRTMTVCEDGYAFRQASPGDSRITAVGAFLRRFSLDELPQLINVIQGRMSLVGPRPHPVAMNEEYRKLVPGYMLRHKVKPGITGLAQIHGFRGETSSLDKMEERIKYDLEYLKQWSFLLDIKIITRTILDGAWKSGA